MNNLLTGITFYSFNPPEDILPAAGVNYKPIYFLLKFRIQTGEFVRDLSGIAAPFRENALKR